MTAYQLPQRPLYQKGERPGADPVRLAAVASLPCCICHEYGMVQESRTQVHHCIHGRHSQARAPDSMTIPLCEGHHTGLVDRSKIALHRLSSSWREAYGPDTNWLSWVEERIAKERTE
jgi:hypothetical protein